MFFFVVIVFKRCIRVKHMIFFLSWDKGATFRKRIDAKENIVGKYTMPKVERSTNVGHTSASLTLFSRFQLCFLKCIRNQQIKKSVIKEKITMKTIHLRNKKKNGINYWALIALTFKTRHYFQLSNENPI